MEKKIAHLGMIQDVISRMGNNSFLLKGWSVTLVSALFALATKDADVFFVYLAFFPTIAFWILDGYFLWQERLRRNLYDYVRELSEEKIDFSMNTLLKDEKNVTWKSAIFSKTFIIFYGSILVSIIIVAVI